MIADSKSLRGRLVASCGCFVALSFLYIQALAGAFAFGTYGSLAHPWRSVPLDVLILSLSAASLVILSVLLRCGSRLQRLGAITLAALPIWVIGHFVVWLLRMYES